MARQRALFKRDRIEFFTIILHFIHLFIYYSKNEKNEINQLIRILSININE